jgi:hypothetical protein
MSIGLFTSDRRLILAVSKKRNNAREAGSSADQLFNMGCLLRWQSYCHPRKTLAIQGQQYNCHPNAVEN